MLYVSYGRLRGAARRAQLFFFLTTSYGQRATACMLPPVCVEYCMSHSTAHATNKSAPSCPAPCAWR